MIVMKFGGTSVCDADRMLRAAELVRDQQQGKPVVLVSALAGVTDSLLRGGQLALEGNHSAVEVLVEELKDRPEQAGHGLAARSGKSWEAVRDELEPVLERVLEIYRGIALVGEMSPRVADFLAGQGEILSSRLMACACRARELSVVWIDPRDWLITNEDYQRAETLVGIRSGAGPCFIFTGPEAGPDSRHRGIRRLHPRGNTHYFGPRRKRLQCLDSGCLPWRPRDSNLDRRGRHDDGGSKARARGATYWGRSALPKRRSWPISVPRFSIRAPSSRPWKPISRSAS